MLAWLFHTRLKNPRCNLPVSRLAFVRAGGASRLRAGLDGLNTKWGDQMTAARHVVDFLGQIQPGDRVALFGLSRDLRILHDYTSDSAALVNTLGAWRGLHGGLLAASQQVSDRQPYGGSAGMGTAGSLTPRYADSPAQVVIEGLMDIIEEEAN